MVKTLTVVGSAIHDIYSFYEEINRVFMATENWSLGSSLDALDDMLGGAYGAVIGKECIELVWKDFEHSRSSLGVTTTRVFLQEKLQQPGIFDTALIKHQLQALEAGTGQTYFEIVLEIIAGHTNIKLVAV